MIMELCNSGAASDVMKVLKTKWTEQEIAVIIKGAMEGLAYLHDRKKIHRDIKAGNILLNTSGEAKLGISFILLL